jgi:hypothetical protein
LKSYKEELERRDKIYKELKEKLKELKIISPVDYQKEMKRNLFGNEVSVYKMRCDYLIPPQHYFQLYLKAAKSETQLDEFYNRSNTYFKEIIRRTKNQIRLLEEILRHPKKSQKYEKLNFNRYYSKFTEDVLANMKEEKTEEKIEEKKERKNLLNRFGILKAFELESEKSQINLEKNIFKRLQENGYDMTNITKEQLIEVFNTIDLQQKIQMMEGNENKMNGFLSYETDFMNYLTQSEKKYLNEDTYSSVVQDEKFEDMMDEFEGVKAKYKEEKIRNAKYFDLLKKYNDRQIKKKNRVDLSEIEKYGDVEKFKRL